jgi:hypothetical protein
MGVAKKYSSEYEHSNLKWRIVAGGPSLPGVPLLRKQSEALIPRSESFPFAGRLGALTRVTGREMALGAQLGRPERGEALSYGNGGR